MVESSTRRGAPAPVYRVARTSTVDLIVQELRSAIYSGALPVGSSLREVEISSQLGVSRGPLREAAQRLVQEGLLTSVPGRGLHITRITGDSIADVYRARLAIESQAVILLSQRVQNEGATVLSPVIHAFQTFATASNGDDAWAIGDSDLAFHQALVDTASSPRLSRIMATLAVETRIISLSMPHGYAVRSSVSPTYNQLLEALNQGDSAKGVAALEQQFIDAVRRLDGKGETTDIVETKAGDVPQTLQPIETSGLLDA